MSGSNPTGSPTAAWVDTTGIHAPTFTDIQSYLTGAFQTIYGQDIVVDPDSQDGQLIAILGLALAETNAMAMSVYQSFSPSTAQGVGLSRVVKINGLTRALPSNSTAELYLVGQAYTVIRNGLARDWVGYTWALPASVTIPASGDITVHATCTMAGDIAAPAHSISIVSTVTLGWQSVDNPLPAQIGAPLETDAELRVRQATSTALPSRSILSGILGAVMQLPGVQHGMVYENDTGNDYSGATPPPAGIGPLPAHSISIVVEGGDPRAICQTILAHKTPGCYTYGTTRETTYDVYGLPHDIGFFIPTPVAIGVHISLKALAGYSTIVGQAISQAVADYINGLQSGDDVVWSKLWAVADLCPLPPGAPPQAQASYDITAITTAAPPGGTYNTANKVIQIFQTATCQASDVVITAS